MKQIGFYPDVIIETTIINKQRIFIKQVAKTEFYCLTLTYQVTYNRKILKPVSPLDDLLLA